MVIKKKQKIKKTTKIYDLKLYHQAEIQNAKISDGDKEEKRNVE